MESKREYDRMNDEKRAAGLPEFRAITYRKDFYATSGCETAVKLARRTERSTRKPSIISNERVERTRVNDANLAVMNRQVRQNFLNQADATTLRIEQLFRKFQNELTALKPLVDIPPWVMDSTEFLDELWQVRNLQEYISLIEKWGPEFALNSNQARKVAEAIGMNRKKADHLEATAKKLEDSLDKLVKNNEF